MRTVLLPVLLLSSSCSFMLNHSPPRYTQERVLLGNSCRQSNWPAGVDLLFAGASGISAIIYDDEGEPVGVLASLGMMAVAGASMVYGFAESSRCRGAHASAGYPVHGANDWLIPPALMLAGLGAVLIAQQPRGAGVSAEQDSCEPGEPLTAQCNDGSLSCSHHRRGTCAYHGGAQSWFRYVTP